ncbi:hypothetical protein GCM10010276_31650 [Streptomyces longisporus]|uniref:N-acetyltransferase domain-containing protein n=1 Tax=Streptomyces longisporus TaxID=1948 RepID=A0ABP5Z0M1_STRLO
MEWLCGAREIDELAVRPVDRGPGLAAGLLEAVNPDAPEGRSRLLTSVRSDRAVPSYRRRGWTQATHPSPKAKASPPSWPPSSRPYAGCTLTPACDLARPRAARPPSP